MKTDPRGMGNLLLVLMVVFLGFHLLILSGTLDASIYWDSTITNADAIWISESIVIVLILVFIAGIQAKLGRFPFRRLPPPCRFDPVADASVFYPEPHRRLSVRERHPQGLCPGHDHCHRLRADPADLHARTAETPGAPWPPSGPPAAGTAAQTAPALSASKKHLKQRDRCLQVFFFFYVFISCPRS